jgi:hypothetical protein
MTKDELIREKLDGSRPLFFDFDGKNCDSCEGWDGESHRCQCGNRRVDWVLSMDGSYIYAEAY